LELEVVQNGRNLLSVRLPDGSTMKIPRDWTATGAALPDANSGPGTLCTVHGLMELALLVAALMKRP
jgi:hypothetical protein